MSDAPNRITPLIYRPKQDHDDIADRARELARLAAAQLEQLAIMVALSGPLNKVDD